MAAAARRDPGPPGREKRIMCVGLVCLDIISVVEAFPAEDSDTRYRRAAGRPGRALRCCSRSRSRCCSRSQRPRRARCRCVSQRWQRGGNASNSCTVLTLLGAPCAFMGSLAPGHAAE